MLVQTWEYKNNFNQLSISLFEDKLSYIRKVQGKILTNEFSFKKMLRRKSPLTTVEFDYQIYKKIAELKQPEDLTEFEYKVWQFWKAFNNSKFSEERIIFEEKSFWVKTKVGFANGYKRLSNNKEIFQLWQSVADFFFYGPYNWKISMNDRIRIKQELFNCLDSSKHNLILEDGFILFDYDKIKPINFEKTEGITGKYFKLDGGKCIVGGWDNPRDGGENYTSVEYLWYNLNTCVPEQFRANIPHIKSILEKAIVR